MADWYVGQKVVCVNDGSWLDWHTWFGWRTRFKAWLDGATDDPVKGGVYEIAEVGVLHNTRWKVGLVLKGFHPDWFYNAEKFRPLVDQNQDISVFTRLLDSLPVMENCDG